MPLHNDSTSTHTMTLGELRELLLEMLAGEPNRPESLATDVVLQSELPHWMSDMYGHFGPDLWVEVQEEDPFSPPHIVQ